MTSGNFYLTRHAAERMGQRNISKVDIRSVGRTGAVKEIAEDKYKVIGSDIDGDELTVVCVYEAGTLVITVF